MGQIHSKKRNPKTSNLKNDEDRRVSCFHLTTGVLTYFPCCQIWEHCRICHFSSCRTPLMETLLDENGIMRNARKKCFSCGEEQMFGEGNCVRCERPFGSYICVSCENACDTPNMYHCNRCNYCVNKNVEHCRSCDECCCDSEHGVKYRCIGHQNECAICLNSMHRYSRWWGRAILKCGHQFHERCLWQSYQSHIYHEKKNPRGDNSPKCPLCREIYYAEEVHSMTRYFKSLTFYNIIDSIVRPSRILNREIQYPNYPIDTPESGYSVQPSAPPIEKIYPEF